MGTEKNDFSEFLKKSEKMDFIELMKKPEKLDFSELVKKPWLNEKEVSALTGRALSTLRNERHMRRGIPYNVVGERSIRYRLTDVIQTMEKTRITFEN